jgi:PII-like signaling protein
LRIFIGESDHYHRKPLYEAIVLEARRRGMAGATVLRGIMGFGADSRMHTAKILRLSEDLPIIVEIVDKPERIAEFLPELDKMIDEGLITLERARVIVYRHSGEQGQRDQTNAARNDASTG